MNAGLPSNMVIGLILPLRLISLGYPAGNWFIDFSPQACLLAKVDWPEFFRQTGIQLIPETFGERFLFRDLQRGTLELNEILDALATPVHGLTGVIVRLDVAKLPDDKACYKYQWTYFYGYCETFAGLDGVLQSLVEKASQGQ